MHRMSVIQWHFFCVKIRVCVMQLLCAVYCICLDTQLSDLIYFYLVSILILVLAFFVIFFFLLHGHHRYLHVLTHSFPTRRSSELLTASVAGVLADALQQDLAVSPFIVASEPGLAASSNLARLADLYQLDFISVHADLVEDPDCYLAISAALDHALSTRSEEHTSELQSLMRISYAVFCLKTQ